MRHGRHEMDIPFCAFLLFVELCPAQTFKLRYRALEEIVYHSTIALLIVIVQMSGIGWLYEMLVVKTNFEPW